MTEESERWVFAFTNPNYSPFDDSSENIYRCCVCNYLTGHRTEYCPKCGDKKDISRK